MKTNRIQDQPNVRSRGTAPAPRGRRGAVEATSTFATPARAVDSTQEHPPHIPLTTAPPQGKLVTVESQEEFDLLSGERSRRVFVKMYVEARASGLLAAISDRDWKTLCVLATYMNADGYCYPSQAELAKALGCSRQMANERIQRLSDFRFQGQSVLLIDKGERAQSGQWSRNHYRVLPIANLDIFRERKTPSITVSSSLDTATKRKTMSTTVSSHAGTVPLDTNENHVSNQTQLDQYLSNVRRSLILENDSRDGDAPQHPSLTQAEACQVAPKRANLGNTEYGEERDIILAYIEDFAPEFNDQAPLKSSTTRALNLFRRSGLSINEFIGRLYEARSITKERTAAIHTRVDSPPDQFRPKNRMSYFYAVLAGLVGLGGESESRGRHRL